MRICEIVKGIEEYFPLSSQENWDNSGFQVKLGNPDVQEILVALEITEEVIDEAARQGIKLIITHHPLLFGSLRQIDQSDMVGNYVCRLVQAGISVYSTHTPFDKCAGGNNDYLGRLLHLKDIRPIAGEETGICREGLIDGACTVREYVLQIEKWLRLPRNQFRFTGNPEAVVEKVGLCTGAGAEFLEQARVAGCDLFITGDVKYHTAQAARETGMNLLDLGHFGTEYIFMENMREWLQRLIPDGVRVMLSEVNFNPFIIL
ncbi:MAG: Nif3-like dinuclear metal center hexameric protein [Firmicutes bacterium]|nr:Nif3-like dinuclear metal center hexameric protein [Bacillota bacterium]